ncbi:MAG: ABC transporter ATP-binding protein [Oscillospiraceae bacterium]|nr:ABC transporter ATP-binding protein [Oscillospiraceae bacterium]
MPIIKKFVSYYKPYRWLFWTDMLCALIVCAVDLAFPQILSYFTKNAFIQPAGQIISILLPLALCLLLMYLVRFGCQYFITSWGHIMGARMESNMRKDLFAQFQRLSFSYYDHNNTGEMMSKLVTDLFDISELAHHGPENLVIALIKILGSCILLLFVNVPLTLILLCITAAGVFYSIWQNKRMQKIFMENRKKIAGVNAQVQDSLAGIRVVKSFANENVELEKFNTSNLQFLSTKEDSYRNMGAYHATNSFMVSILYIVTLVCGGYFIAQGTLAPADLAIYALYIGIFISPIEMLINFTEMMQKGYSGFKRFCDVLAITPDIQDAPCATDIGEVAGNILLQDVSFQYDDAGKVLEHINIEIEAGKTIALVGPSGGGKTTICSLLPRFYDVTGGRVAIDGKDIRSLTLDSLRSAIGIVQQDVYMFAGSIGENIGYGCPNATQEEIVAAAKQANIHDFIVGLPQGYNTYVGERGTRLSGGQKQRLSIARVFLKNPRILIFDEATSALDNESERHIQQSLERLAKGRTTIVIAHRLSTIHNADEIIVIANGKIKERGTHAALLEANQLYAKYYNMQFEDLDEIS